MSFLKRQRLRIITVALCVAALLIVLVGCGGTPSTGSTGSDAPADNTPVATAPVVWSPDVDCVTCHVAEDPTGGTVATTGAFHADQAAQCVTCHNSESELNTIHEGATATAKMPVRLKTTKVTDEVCLGCHVKSELATQTVNSTALTDSNGLTVNPHQLPEVGTHQSITCTECHYMHKPADDLAANAKAKCVSCHHQDVFECNTCHDA
jgi:hypothetical protein